MITIEELVEGSGPEAQDGDRMEVHYVGMFEDGSQFDSSRDRGQTFQVVLGRTGLIQGFTMGLMGMKEGQRRKVTIPGAFGYGERGAPPAIPPNATLVFDIELIKLN
jgi:FKBP-type peptidyl-prolyl cis-trans isomerase